MSKNCVDLYTFDNGRCLLGSRLWNGLPMTLLDASARQERCAGVGGVEIIHAMNNRDEAEVGDGR